MLCMNNKIQKYKYKYKYNIEYVNSMGATLGHPNNVLGTCEVDIHNQFPLKWVDALKLLLLKNENLPSPRL